jgi:iron complex outermembrane receptor protein
MMLSTIFCQNMKGDEKINMEINGTYPDTIDVDTSAVLSEVVVKGYEPRYTTSRISGSLRLNQPIIQVPQNVQSVSRKLLDDMQILTAADGLQRTVSGVSKLEHWSDYVRINMRGARAAAFREGMNVTSNWGPLTEDMSYVDHIEFVKGPAGFMMSNGEPSGLYNVVTKKPTGKQKGQVTFTVGSYDLYRATLDLDGKLTKNGKLLYRLNLMGSTQNSQRANEFAKRYSLAPVLRYLIDNNTTLTFEYDLQYVEQSNIGSSYVFSPTGYATLPRNYSLLEPGLEPTKTYDHTAIANLQHYFSTDWKLTAQLAYFNLNRTGSSMWPTSLDDDGNLVRGVNNADVLNEMKFAQIFVNGKAKTGPVSHTVLAGLDFGDKHAWYDWSQHFDLDSTGTYNVFSDTPSGTPYYGYPHFDRSQSIKERANNTQIWQTYQGIYLQDALGFFNDRLFLTLAGRFTHVKDESYGTNKTNVNHFSPRVGVTFLFDDFTSVYALYDQTFSPQTGRQRNGDKVDPITGNNWELGLKRTWWDGRLSTSLALYRILRNNETSADPQNTQQEDYLIQVGQSVAKGVEVDIIGEILPGLNLIANYAFTDYKVTKSEDSSRPVGTRLPGYGKHEFNVWLKYQVQNGIFRGLSAAVGETSLLDRSTWNWGNAENGYESLPDYTRVDASLGWRNNRLGITLNVNNLLNRYLYSGSYYGNYYYWQSEMPRNFKLTVSYNF